MKQTIINQEQRNIKLVGPQYQMTAAELENMYKEVVGEDILIVPDDDNLNDPKALEAKWHISKTLAYICKEDKDLVWKVMGQADTEWLHGKIVGIDRERNWLFATIDGVDLTKISDTVSTEQFDLWQYSGPKLPWPNDVKNANLTSVSIIGIIDKAKGAKKKISDHDLRMVKEGVGDFCKFFCHDLSIEAECERKALKRKLEEYDGKSFAEEIAQLDYIGTHKGTLLTFDGGFHKWFDTYKRHNLDKLKSLRIDPELVDKVRGELALFPGNLYDIYLQRNSNFVLNLYYCSVPREKICQLLSGIAFVECHSQESIYSLPVIKVHANDKPLPQKPQPEESPKYGFLHNEQLFIDTVREVFKSDEKGEIWVILYSIAKYHERFGYEGDMKVFHSTLCQGVFKSNLKYESLSQAKSRSSCFNAGGRLNRENAKRQHPQIKLFLDKIDEHFSLKLNKVLSD